VGTAAPMTRAVRVRVACRLPENAAFPRISPQEFCAPRRISHVAMERIPEVELAWYLEYPLGRRADRKELRTGAAD